MEKKGISLIVLVITIIVMIMLSTVIILSLTNSGIIERSKEAKNKTILKGLEEVIQRAVVTSKTDGGGSLLEELRKIQGASISGGEGVYYVTTAGQTITVFENGETLEGRVSTWDGETVIAPPTKDDEIIYINTSEEFAWFRDQVNAEVSFEGKTVILEANIDLGARKINETYSSEYNWEPIESFDGTFDGKNHVITGLYINSGSNIAGLFGEQLATSIIKNLTVKNGYVLGNQYVGGVIGYSRGSVTNCNNQNTTVKVTAATDGLTKVAGVVVGILSKNQTAENCYNTGTVIGEQYAGGVVGAGNTSSLINSCYNTGTVTGKYIVGGVTASSTGNITNCYNTGALSVTGTGTFNTNGGYIGGITGTISSAEEDKIENCYNTGDISSDVKSDINNSTIFMGGITGSGYNMNIITCYNTGNLVNKSEVEDLSYMAGIIGYNSICIIKNSYNLGIIKNLSTVKAVTDADMTSYMYTAGIAGYSTGTVSSCYNKGKIMGYGTNYNTNGTNTAGIVSSNTATIEGVQYSGTIENCYNTAIVTAKRGIEEATNNDNVGGICAYSATTSTIKNCYNIGEVIRENNIKSLGVVVSSTYNTIFINNYYLSGLETNATNTNGTKKTVDEMKIQSFVDALNSGTTVWVKDNSNKNNGYPILNW